MSSEDAAGVIGTIKRKKKVVIMAIFELVKKACLELQQEMVARSFQKLLQKYSQDETEGDAIFEEDDDNDKINTENVHSGGRIREKKIKELIKNSDND